MKNQTLKEYSKDLAKQLVKAVAKFEVKEVKGEGTFEVVATTEGVDRDGEVILIKGWDFANFMKNPVVLFGHNYYDYPIGAVTSLDPQDNQVIARGVFARTEQGKVARQLYEDGMLKTVSVGFIVKERQGNVITKAELLELSFVPVPSNPDALDTRKEVKEFENMLKTCVKVDKAVVKFEETEKTAKDTEWDVKVALDKIKEWATDEKGNLDESKYKQAFTWVDESAEGLDKYKLLHHSVVGDKLNVVWRGVAASMAALLGENDFKMADEEKKSAYNHLKKHYEQYEMEAPVLKSYTQYELDNLFPSGKSDLPEETKEFVGLVIDTLKKDVNSLLTDAVENIKSVTGDVKKSAKPTEKAGRTLSAKTRRTIKNAVDAMATATTALNDLVNSSDASKEDDDKKHFDHQKKTLQSIAKAAQKALTDINRIK